MQAPARIDTAPGLKIDVTFYPMREVGGDFYLGRTRAPADASWRRKQEMRRTAMAATHLQSAVTAPDGDPPGEPLI